MNTTAQRDFMFYIGNQGQVISLRNQLSIHINCAPLEVFQGLADLEQTSLWRSSVQENKITSAQPVDLGTTYTVLYRVGGRLPTVQGTVTAFHPGRHLAVRETDPNFVVETDYILTPVEGGTRLDVVSYTHGTGGVFSMMLRLLGPRTARSSRKALTRDMEAFKQLIEMDRLTA